MTEDLNRLLEIGQREPGAAQAEEGPPLSPQGRWFLRAFLGFLGISALLGLFVILAGNMGKFEGQVLGSTFSKVRRQI